MSVSNNAPDDSLDILRKMLRQNAEDIKAADRMRILAAKYARSVGLTNQEIADAYGMTEGAVRKMLQRAEGDS